MQGFLPGVECHARPLPWTTGAYQILTEAELQGKPYFIEKWEKEINKKFEDQQVERIIASVHNTATDMNTIEINYKCISRCHRTPEEIHRYRYSKDKTPLCWSECGQIGTTHIWWDCPKIKEYWQEIRNMWK